MDGFFPSEEVIVLDWILLMLTCLRFVHEICVFICRCDCFGLNCVDKERGLSEIRGRNLCFYLEMRLFWTGFCR